MSGNPPMRACNFFFYKWLARPEKPGYHFVLGNNVDTGP